MPWLLCGFGTIFCLSGIFLFFKHIYEKDSSVKWPVAIVIMGVLLIAIGTAAYFNLLP
jgi:uncharacterized membrane protein HdeD (DUF308 family)